MGTCMLSFSAQTGRDWEHPFHSGEMEYLPQMCISNLSPQGNLGLHTVQGSMTSTFLQIQTDSERHQVLNPHRTGKDSGFICANMELQLLLDQKHNAVVSATTWAHPSHACSQTQSLIYTLGVPTAQKEFSNRIDMNLHNVITTYFLNKGMLFHIFLYSSLSS